MHASVERPVYRQIVVIIQATTQSTCNSTSLTTEDDCMTTIAPILILSRAAGLSASSHLWTWRSLPLTHPRRVGKPAVKMMTPVRYILLALFLIVRTLERSWCYVARPVTYGLQRVLVTIPTDQSPLHPQLLTRRVRSSDLPIEHQRQVWVVFWQTALSKRSPGGVL